MEVRSILAIIIVNFVLTSAQWADQFQNLFDSIARNDERNNEAYRDIVKDDVEKDRHAFDTMKEELRLTRIGNFFRQKNSHDELHFGEKVKLTKRKTEETKRRRARMNGSEYIPRKKVVRKKVNKTKTLYLAVLPMAGFERYYFEVTPLNLERPPKILIKNEKTGDKKLTCDTIFRNPSMVEAEGADTVDPMDKQIQEELRAKRPDMYERYYKPPNVMVMNQIDLQFLNGYRKYNFTIGGVITQEAAFPCLARKRSTGNIEEYLVSQTYILPSSELPPDLMRNERKLGPLVAARFVILRDGATNDTTLVALADRAVEEVRPVNPKYCERTELTTPGRSKELCEIPEIQQIRLCASLFNSANYSQLFEYAATSTPPDCRESKLSVRCEEEGSLEFTDTVLDCQVTRTGTGSSRLVSYYISLSFKPYQFLVATSEEGSAVPVVKDVFSSHAIKLVQPEVPDLPIG